METGGTSLIIIRCAQRAPWSAAASRPFTRLSFLGTLKDKASRQALKARNSKAQGVSPGAGMRKSKSAVRAAQGFCFALTALYLFSCPNPGLAPWAGLFRAFGASPSSKICGINRVPLEGSCNRGRPRFLAGSREVPMWEVIPGRISISLEPVSRSLLKKPVS